MNDVCEVNLNVAESFIRAYIQHYKADKYWSRREQ